MPATTEPCGRSTAYAGTIHDQLLIRLFQSCYTVGPGRCESQHRRQLPEGCQ
ncbi:MAG: hypothetical protein H7Z21_07645 [Hymenobacter sp.]|nr:hypothetical protein [Hymenobacter sp.]